MSRTITFIGFFLIALSFIALNVYASRKPDRLVPLGDLVTKLISDRSTRLALFAFWWWVGYHFLYSNL